MGTFTSSKTVKLIAKPDTWFKEGTEVFNCDDTKRRRFTCEELALWRLSGIILCSGTRIKQHDSEQSGYAIGEEYQDEETCLLEEFDIIEDC